MEFVSPPSQHEVQLTIKNETSADFLYRDAVYREGQLSGDKWPVRIHPGQVVDVTCCGKKEEATFSNCSGYVSYSFADDGKLLTIAFYNNGSENKINVGCEPPMQVWTEMRSFNYEPITKRIRDGPREYTVVFQCTSGPLNRITVTVSQ
eukprot:scpid91663/ scgid16199/ 